MTDTEKKIAEETANSLADAFTEMNKSFEEWTSSIAEYITKMSAKIAITLVDKATNAVLYSQKKLERATFLTRWYWRRRVKKDAQKLVEITETVDEYLNEMNKI